MKLFTFFFLGFVLLTGSSLRLSAQEEVENNFRHTVYLHLLDFTRIGSPALKISYERQIRKKLFLSVETSLISDFNGRIYRTKQNERGIIGSSLALNSMYAIPLNGRTFALLGLRLNYAYKRRTIEEWVNRTSYRQFLEYQQINHNLGAYFRMASVRYHSNNLVVSFGINSGMLLLYVNPELPPGTSLINRNFFFSRNAWLSNQKEKGFYIYPHFYFEINLGYQLARLK